MKPVEKRPAWLDGFPRNGHELKGRTMGRAHITTVTSREFAHNVSAAKRVASEGGTVIITDRGEPSLALMPIAEYRRLTRTDKNMIELLRMPEADGIDIDFEPIRIDAKDIDA
jgi:antitoxin (DNA-binding transcriptional repressor) of toxin-antitoxin stability system